MQKEILCFFCKRPITSKDDLVTAYYTLPFFFRPPLPYHSACYAEGLKTWKIMFLQRTPINSIGYTALAIASFIIGVGGLIFLSVMLIINPEKYLNILFVALVLIVLTSIFPMVRLYSYLKYEKFINPKK